MATRTKKNPYHDSEPPMQRDPDAGEERPRDLLGGGLGLSVSLPADSDHPDDDLEQVAREAEAARAARQAAPVYLDAGASKKGAWTAPTDAPLAGAVSGTPSVASWRVWRDEDGARTYLGTIASHATPEALISRFPAAMPDPGQSILYILKGVSATGQEAPGVERPFRISGDSPAVQQAKARATPAAATVPTGPSPLENTLAELLRRQHERDEADRRALEVERRELAEKLANAAAAQAQAQTDWAARQLAAESARHQQALESERERRRQDREDADARLRADLAERERRDTREREDRDRKDAREREERLAERERDREFQQRMAALSAASSLESTVAKAAALMTSLGVSPGDLIGKILSSSSAEPASGMAEGTAAAVAGVVGKVVDQIGNVVAKQMELQSQLQQQADPDPEPPMRRRLPPPMPSRLPVPVARPRPVAPRIVPEPKQEPNGEPQEANSSRPEAAPAPTPTRIDPGLTKDLPMPVMRKARVALRELAEKLSTLPEDQWQAEILAVGSKVPSILIYCKAVGVKAAAVEAGMDEETATKLASRAAALGV